MRIRVTAPAFCDHSAIDDKGNIELNRGTRLSGLLKILRIPLILKPILLVTVNYSRVKSSTVLKEGDTVSIYWPVSGG